MRASRVEREHRRWVIEVLRRSTVVTCPDCDDGMAPCEICDGKGYTSHSCGVCGEHHEETCDDCQPRGSGKVRCKRCDGTGILDAATIAPEHQADDHTLAIPFPTPLVRRRRGRPVKPRRAKGRTA